MAEENDDLQDDDVQNDDLTGVFDRLRRDVTSTVDAEAALTELERREQRARGRASRARWLAAAAAIVVLVAGGVGIARWRSTESDVNVVPATTTAPPEPVDDCPDRSDLFVYFEVAATDAQIDAVRTELDASGATSIKWYGVEESYDEFRQLFADQPDLVASIEPTDFPRSFRASTATPSAASELGAALESRPGVLRVETGSGVCPGKTDDETAVWECTWDEVVDLSAVVPERFDRASSAVQGEPGAQWCARRWGAIGHPDMSSITQYLPEIQLPGLVPEASAAGFTWGTVDGMRFLRHDEAPQWGLVADGLTEEEWTALRQTLVG